MSSAAGKDNSVREHSQRFATTRWSIVVAAGHRSSPDGKWLAATGEEGAYSGLIKMWDTDTFESKVSIQQKQRIRLATFTHDSEQLVIADDEGIVKVFDLAAGNYRQSL